MPRDSQKDYYKRAKEDAIAAAQAEHPGERIHWDEASGRAYTQTDWQALQDWTRQQQQQQNAFVATLPTTQIPAGVNASQYAYDQSHANQTALANYFAGAGPRPDFFNPTTTGPGAAYYAPYYDYVAEQETSRNPLTSPPAPTGNPFPDLNTPAPVIGAPPASRVNDLPTAAPPVSPQAPLVGDPNIETPTPNPTVTTPPPNVVPPPTSLTTGWFHGETDPLGSIYSTMRQANLQATLPASMRTTYH